jgi:hypothetical protein
VSERAVRKASLTVTTTGPLSGYVQTHREKTADTLLCKAVVALYYHALEAILYCGKVRLMNDQNSAMSTPMHSFMNQIVILESFPRALLGCSSVCYQSVWFYSETTCITLHATYAVRFYYVHQCSAKFPKCSFNHFPLIR